MSEAIVTSYTELMAGIQAQVGALGLKLTDFDDLTGWPAGMSGKVFGLLQVKRLSAENLFVALNAVGFRMRLELDPEQQAKIKARVAANYLPRNAMQARPGHAASLPSTQVLSRILKPIGDLGRKSRWAKTTPKERSEHARMMAMARVKKRRKEMARRARQQRKTHKARKGGA